VTDTSASKPKFHLLISTENSQSPPPGPVPAPSAPGDGGRSPTRPSSSAGPLGSVSSHSNDRTARLVAEILGMTAVRAIAILTHVGGLAGLAYASEADLVGAGLSRRRARAVRAAFELGRTSVGASPRIGSRLAGSSDVYQHMRARLAGRIVEEFWMLGLDVRHRVVLDEMAARGSLTGVEVHPRDIFRRLIRAGVAAVIFAHNHPSGDPSPSRQDIELTSRLREVGDMCGIAVLDHVVVGFEGYVSIAERHWR
jgi:DNA repair protein RadC